MQNIVIAAPLAGWLMPVDAVPDAVFAERMLGDGIAIDPTDGQVVAPCDATVVSVHEAGHAVTLDCGGGVTILIHVGLDTVALGGRGFSPAVAVGNCVRTGQPLLRFDLDAVSLGARSLVTPLVVTAGTIVARPRPSDTMVQAGDAILTVQGEATTDASPERTPQAPPPPAQTASRTLTLLLAHGLHARPAARLAAEARRFDARASLVAADGRRAPADSPVALLALALRHGAVVAVDANGPEADAAADAIVALLDSGMGELRPVAEAPAADLLIGAGDAPPARITGPLRGSAAAPGLAIGIAHHLIAEVVPVPRDGAGEEAETAAFIRARDQLRDDLAREADGTGPGAAINAAHLAFIDDPAIDATVRVAVREGRSAPFAWQSALEGFRDQLRGAGDARFAERADDLADLQRRLIAILLDVPPPPPPPAGSIVLAEDLFPSDLAAIAAANVAGLATARGGPTSHAAIIAAGIGLPMVTALGATLHAVAPGTQLILDGDAGSLTIGTQAEAAAARAAIEARQRIRAAAKAHAADPAITRDGVRIEVAANIGVPAEAAAAVAEGADGCGLLRTELLFLDRSVPPTLDEQRALYQSVADALGDRPLIVRTLDIGADKPAPYLPMAAEENPALGLRGIRLQRAVPGLLDTQLRALLGVTGPGRLHIMLPMVTQIGEIAETRALLARLAAEAGREPPPLGIMVETPAAALIADRLAEQADFLSIGTNDLTQYTLAADRTNAAVAPLVDGCDPAVLRLIGMAATGAAGRDRWTGLCGGMAADAGAVPLLIGLGVTELSVPPARIAETKALVRTLDRGRCRDLAQRALAATDAGAVRQMVKEIA